MSPTVEQVEIGLYNPAKEQITLGQHSSSVVEGLVLCRIRTSDGLVGCSGLTTYTEHAIDRSIFASVCSAARTLIGVGVDQRERIHQQLWRRYDFLRAQSSSLIDLALWDAAAKAAELPLYRYLGAARERVPVYASIPSFASVEEYLERIDSLARHPYHAVKIHPFCEVERDLELIRAIAARFGNQQRFYFDAEGQYSREAALRVGRELSRHPCFEFFEAPMPDSDLEGYAWLRSRIEIPLVMSGIELFAPALQSHAVKLGACDRLRFDTTLTGGVTVARKLIAIAEAAGLSTEIQSWGYAITQAANLHMMLTTASSTGFEQAVPHEPYLWGTEDVIRIDSEGYARPSEKPGLGVDYIDEVIEPCRVDHCLIR